MVGVTSQRDSVGESSKTSRLLLALAATLVAVGCLTSDGCTEGCCEPEVQLGPVAEGTQGIGDAANSVID